MSSQPTGLDAALERLSAAPYEQFTETRDALAKEARAAGDAELAAQLKKERRPTVTVWALNQLARRKPKVVEEVLESGERLRQAQEAAVRGEGGGPLRDATAEQRHVLGTALKEAMDLVREAGSAGSTDQHDRMEGTMLACANGPGELGDQWRRARLEKDLPRPGFGDLGGLAASAHAAGQAPSHHARPKAVAPGDGEAETRRAQRERDRLLQEAEHRAREAAKALADARRRRERAEESAQRAAKALEEATAAAQRSREALAASEDEVSKAESEQRAADQALALLR